MRMVSVPLAAARVSQRDLVNPEPDRPSIRERHRLLDVDLRRIRLHDEAVVRDVEMGGGLPGELEIAPPREERGVVHAGVARERRPRPGA